MRIPTTDDELERTARRRAGAKLGWYMHAVIYVLVNSFLIALALAHGRNWALFPVLGWGIGLLAHGAGVFVGQPGGRLHAHLLNRERAKLQALRQP